MKTSSKRVSVPANTTAGQTCLHSSARPAAHACRQIAIILHDHASNAGAASSLLPVSGPTANRSSGGCAQQHTPCHWCCSHSTTNTLLLRLRRADALGARLRQLVGRGRRGRQHRLDLVQARPVLAGYEDALGRRVVRDACRVFRASGCQTGQTGSAHGSRCVAVHVATRYSEAQSYLHRHDRQQ